MIQNAALIGEKIKEYSDPLLRGQTTSCTHMTAELRDPTSTIGRCLQGTRLLYYATLIFDHKSLHICLAYEFLQTSICNGNRFVMKIHTNTNKIFMEIKAKYIFQV